MKCSKRERESDKERAGQEVSLRVDIKPRDVNDFSHGVSQARDSRIEHNTLTRSIERHSAREAGGRVLHCAWTGPTTNVPLEG